MEIEKKVGRGKEREEEGGGEEKRMEMEERGWREEIRGGRKRKGRQVMKCVLSFFSWFFSPDCSDLSCVSRGSTPASH